MGSHRHKKINMCEGEREIVVERQNENLGTAEVSLQHVQVEPQEDKIEILRHVPMVTRCPPCGVERIGSRSPGALGLFWDTESTAPGRSSPRPRTASPYPTMWSLPFVVFVRRFRFVRIALFNFLCHLSFFSDFFFVAV